VAVSPVKDAGSISFRSLENRIMTLLIRLAVCVLIGFAMSLIWTGGIAVSAPLAKKALAPPAEALAFSTAPIEVMVLGAYHMGNPGRDINNVEVGSVLTPVRQKEIADVANRLARFKPTKIAVEMVADQTDLTTSAFAKFTPATLTKEKNEIDQIGFRLASQLGHKQVYAVDEQSATVDYFPFEKLTEYAKTSNQQIKVDAMLASSAVQAKKMEAAIKTKTVREMLMSINTGDYGVNEMRDFYWPLNAIGDDKQQPGAELNAMWFMRNTKIMSKITQIAKPGDRIIVMFGAGHGYWLRQMVSGTPGFRLVEPNTFLK
jgi:Family of unknown function (DUF5694)